LFTGIVQARCKVSDVADEENLRRIGLRLGDLASDLAPGASVAVNGVCLTATHIDRGVAWFDVIEETLRRTNLGLITRDSLVNVERSMRVGDEIGGHVLSGHVVDMVTVARVEGGANRRVIWFSVARDWTPYLIHKGFVALDGASLTVSSIDDATFAVSLIPETIARTSLGSVDVGDRVNLELDSQTQAVVSTITRLLADPGWRTRFLSAANHD
jgi:riboflavin synthase